MFVYLAISDYSVSGVLIREEENAQHPVYYISKRLLDAETRYPDMEKLALALITASRKLRPYFHAHAIVVLTNYPLRQVLQNPDTSRRLLKWAIELGQFEVDYRLRVAIKGQAVADFIVEFSYKAATKQKAEERPEQPRGAAKLTLEGGGRSADQLAVWTLYVDGSSNENGSGQELFFLALRVIECILP